MKVVSGAEAAALVAAEPCNVMIYGPPGSYKTTDAVRTFVRDGRCTAFFVKCEPGALKPIVACGLPVPDHNDEVISTWDQLTQAVMYAGSRPDLYNAVIIDTITNWNAAIVGQLESVGYKNNYKMWADMRKMLFGLRDGARALGLHVVYIAHAMNPYVDEQGNYNLGGPLLQPKTAVPIFSGGVDTLLRVGYVSIGARIQRVYFTGGEEWPADYGIPPQDVRAWHVKNREGVNKAAVPADLAAFLRSRNPPYLL